MLNRMNRRDRRDRPPAVVPSPGLVAGQSVTYAVSAGCNSTSLATAGAYNSVRESNEYNNGLVC
jgi:hypothetical protein